MSPDRWVASGRRQHAGQLGGQAGQRLSRCHRPGGATSAACELGRVVDDGLDEGPVRLVHVLEAGSRQHPAAAGVDLGGDLGHEPALAHPCLPGHHGEQRVAAARQLPPLAQLVVLLVRPTNVDGVGEQAEGGRQRLPVGGHRRRWTAAGELATIRRPELAQQGRHVRLDRALGDVQPGGDLGVRQVLADELQDV